MSAKRIDPARVAPTTVAKLIPKLGRTSVGALAVLTLILVFQNLGKAAQDQLPPDALPFSLSYTITGDFAVASMDLLPQPDNQDGDPGYQTGTIHVGTSTARVVPPNAEILAAFLYWETLAGDAVVLDAQFRGLPVSLARVSQQQLTGVYAPCWSQSGNTLFSVRADVLSLLPLQKDENGFPTGRRLVNDMDLTAAGLPAHTVRLPEAGTGNQTPQSAGASLFLVYRDPSMPLKRVVVYDGLHVQQKGATTVQRLRGFLQSDVTGPGQAKLTQIVSRGAANPTEAFTFDGVSRPLDSFAGTLSPDSDRAWASPTLDVSPQMPGTVEDYTNTVADEREFGEQATITSRYTNPATYGCHTWAAIAFSTIVRDHDHDGLIDLLEKEPTQPGVSVFRDPNGAAYPKLWAMGASPDQRDLFVEVNSFKAAPGTHYGSLQHPFPLASQNPVNGVITDLAGHNHKPTPNVLRLAGEALARANVVVHFDVGNPASYKSPAGSAYASSAADAYIIGAGGASGSDPSLATGGESIDETYCTPGQPLCQFPAFPGTINWKFGLQLIRDQLDATSGQRRFDPIRNHIFHYMLFAHARGMATSPWPCLNPAQNLLEVGLPVNPYSTVVPSCADGGFVDNPGFHVPRGVSGVSDLPGYNSMVTLGLSRNFVGTEFFQASTMVHEFGHSFELWHGGAPPVFSLSTKDGAPAGSVHVDIQPNCKPGYQSTMSYLHQLQGLIDLSGAPNIDYSNARLGIVGGLIDETTSLGNATLLTTDLGARRYRPAWYSPIVKPNTVPDPDVPGNVAFLLDVPAATRHCDGTPLLPEELKPDGTPIAPVGRVEADSPTPASIDWAGDDHSPLLNLPSDLDVNYDGTKGALQGINDLDYLRPDQLGGGQNDGGFSVGIAYVGPGLTVDAIPYYGGPQYIGGVPFGAGGVAYPGGGIAYPGAGLYVGGIVFGGGGVAFGAGGVAFGGAGVVFGGGGVPFGGAGYPIADGILIAQYPSGVPFGGAGVAFGGAGVPFGAGGVPFGAGGVAFPGGGVVYPGGGVAFPGAGVVYPGGGVAFPGGGELTHGDIEALGHAAPNQVTVCRLGVDCAGTVPAPPQFHRHLVKWSAATLDSPSGFRAFRVLGTDAADDSGAAPAQIDAPASATSVIDEELPDATNFTYWMKAKYGAPLGVPSFPLVTVTAVNVAPVATANSYDYTGTLPAVIQGSPLDNDTDADMGPAGKSKWRLVIVNASGVPVAAPAGLTINPDGKTFSYNAASGSTSFYYKVDTGKWTDGVTKMSLDSAPALVTITVRLRGPR